MALTEKQLGLIRESFDILRQDLSQPSQLFYEELFERAPHLRSLFRDDLGGQGMRFMTTLAVLVDNLHQPDVLSPRYHDLGTRHARLGITAEMFVPMREALLATIKETLGDRHDPEIAAAWRVAFDEMAAAMTDRGNIPKS
ncbi:MAG: globin domain-containing protein [Rhodobacter sp.]|nr:globin domain-containing protein [Rhodobacter sp.]